MMVELKLSISQFFLLVVQEKLEVLITWETIAPPHLYEVVTLKSSIPLVILISCPRQIGGSLAYYLGNYPRFLVLNTHSTGFTQWLPELEALYHLIFADISPMFFSGYEKCKKGYYIATIRSTGDE